jgi:hypothetical protein
MRKLLTLEEIYDNFDVPYIRKLMRYSDKRNPIDTSRVIIHEGLSSMEVLDDTKLISGDINKYAEEAKRLEESLVNKRDNMPYIDDDMVEIPKDLLKQLLEVINRNNK